MNSPDDYDSATAQQLLSAWKAMREGKLTFLPSLKHHGDELLAAPFTAVGLVDTKGI